MWKLVNKKEIVQGDMIALVHKDTVVLEGTYLKNSSWDSCVYTGTAIISIPNTRLKFESSEVFEDGGKLLTNLSFTMYGDEDPDYEFYKWENIPVKFDLNEFRGN